MAKILSGAKASQKVIETLKLEINSLKENNVIPGLAVILVGDDSSSKIYVKNKKKVCLELGIYLKEYILPASTKEEELLLVIEELNIEPKIHGILIQLPLPSGINTKNIINKISPGKDVDGFTTTNMGRVIVGDAGFIPCTALGILELLEQNAVPIEGKNVVVVGRSNIVGKPTAMLLLNRDATVTICHSKTQNLEKITKNADILIAAIGSAKFITKKMVKPGAVVLDIGINRIEDEICGDVDFKNVATVASAITPVPGGIGPMTIAMLMRNIVTSAKRTVRQN